jgi:DNA polymerase elongation subunit (family B)
MHKDFYTNVTLRGNDILYRGIENGEPVQYRVPYKPRLFVPTNDESEYKTLYGENCRKIEFENIDKARSFVSGYEDLDGFRFFGNTRWQYAFLSDRFPLHIDYDESKITTAIIDIEVDTTNGFAPTGDPFGAITAITVKARNRFYVFGIGEFVTEDASVKYIRSKDEFQLLAKFLEFWEKLSPNIISGWNVSLFDIPYLTNRIRRVLGDKEVKRLSPWKIISEKTVNYKGRSNETYTWIGIDVLDYIELYRKFQPKQESEKLNYISYVELGEKKLDYSEHGSLEGLYRNDHQKFIEYNIKDVELVDRLEQKLQLIAMSFALIYDARVTYGDVFTQVTMWDAIIHHDLAQKNIVVPQAIDSHKDEKYAGAFVKDITPGMYNWVVSLDLNSLYPMLISQFNISPETLVPPSFISGTFSKNTENKYDISLLLEQRKELTHLIEEEICMAANGHCFTLLSRGFLPDILMRKYEDRKTYKQKMTDSQKELERINAELKKRNLK